MNDEERLRNAMIYGTSHPEIYKTAQDEEIERLRAENEQLKNMINLYDEMVAVLLPSWEIGSDDDEKAEYMITYTNIKKALG